jgi:hypothetical protein
MEEWTSSILERTMKRLVVTILVSTLIFPVSALAQGWAGALEGLGRAGQDVGRQLMDEANERERLERLNKMQMEQDRRRFEYEKQLLERRHQIEREQALEQQRAATQAKLDQQRVAEQAKIERLQLEAERVKLEKAKVEQAHPHWEQTVRSPRFSQWRNTQPASVKALANSDKAEDAVLMLDLYKRDTAVTTKKSAKKKGAGTKTAQP